MPENNAPDLHSLDKAVHHEDDTEGHIAGGGPDAPDFVVDVPPRSSDEDDAEGHYSGARRVEPTVPSAARDLDATRPKADDDNPI